MVGRLWSDRLLYYEEDMPLQAVKGHLKSNGGEYVGSTGVPHLTREYRQYRGSHSHAPN